MRTRFGTFGCIAAGGLLTVAGAAQANSVVNYTYHFTGADLINNQFVSGADGSTAAENELFEGARLLRDGANPNHADAARTYVDSEHSTFNARWDTMTELGYVLNSFNLWGIDGNGINWGEDHKPFDVISATAPENWNTGLHDAEELWPAWYSNLDDPHTGKFPWWQYDGPGGIALNADAATLQSLQFSVTLAFDLDDAWWGQAQQGQGASLELDSLLTMWFGGNITRYGDDSEELDTHMYEGNMTAIVPTPAAAGAGLVLMGLLGMRRGRRKAIDA